VLSPPESDGQEPEPPENEAGKAGREDTASQARNPDSSSDSRTADSQNEAQWAVAIDWESLETFAVGAATAALPYWPAVGEAAWQRARPFLPRRII
jgi:hypothetical protein